ncbi:MAG: aminotransferase class V-fold PLP-dependent enzyme [Clostridia bacterium]|nr:aminotransferase class V-fold PLP-dependent enzyme [Clostridia bacterium]
MEKLIYFDHAATSWPKPPAVREAMCRATEYGGGNPGRSGHVLSVRAARGIYECREAVCSLFSFNKPERIIFTQNATYALNTAICGLASPGAHIVISNLEHNSVLRPVHKLSQSGRITYSMFDATDDDDDECVYCFKRVLRDNTRLAVITAASNICGKILPIEKIAAVCHARGIKLIVDGAQAGGVFPLNFSLSGADVLCLAGHKGLYGPQGTGIMICGENAEPESFAQGGNGINSEMYDMGDILPERLEAGTLNTPGLWGLCEGIKYVMRETVEEIFGKTLLLTRYAAEGIANCRDVVSYGNYGVKAPVILFNKKGMSPDELASYLSDHGICVRAGLHCAPIAHKACGTGVDGGVRVSFGHLNTRREIDRLLLAVNRA